MKKLLMVVIALFIFTFTGCEGLDGIKCREAVVNTFPEDTIYRVAKYRHVIITNDGRVFYVFNNGTLFADSMKIVPMLLVQEGSDE